jgi:predicted nucleic acid-binding protein
MSARTLCGPNHLFMGAHACSLGATLVASNRSELERVSGLAIEVERA